MYLHGSRKLFGKDFLLLPQKNGYVQSEEVKPFEDFVESRRPKDKLAS